MLADRVAAKNPNMVLASTYLPPDGAVACYLLHRMWSRGDTTRTRWHSIFVNSGVEAIGTVVKYMRNRVNRSGCGRACRILILDPTETAVHAFGHSVPGLSSAVDDGIAIVGDADDFCARLPGHWDGYIAVVDGIDEPGMAKVQHALASVEPQQKIIARGVLRNPSAWERLCSSVENGDVIFLGEVCTNSQIPCGTVSFTHQAFSLWNNPIDCIAHVSTFGGNGIALALLCARLAEIRPADRGELATIERIRANPTVRRARVRLHANSWQTRNIDIAGVNITFDRADGVTYTSNNRRYVDLASGAGTAFRGHNQQSPAFISSVGTQGDEVRRLERKLAALTALPVMLPAVSGASAVDNAMLAALGARPGRSTIVTLCGNYSGKGPLSLALSRTSPFFRDLDDQAFRPYPVRVIEVDVDDIASLRKALRRDDIALVWMEAALGFDCVRIPRAVLAEVDLRRESTGYLVGFDEIFTAFWRGSPGSFLASDGFSLRPDLVAVSKALSDALMPIGATMVSASVFDDLTWRAPDTSNWLRSHYRSTFGAGLALAALDAAEETHNPDPTLEAALETMLVRAVRSPVFTGYRRVGLLGKLQVVPPSRLYGPLRQLMGDGADALVARLIALNCAAITLQMRFAPCTAGIHQPELVRAFDAVGAFLEQLSLRRYHRAMVTSVAEFVALETASTIVAIRERRRDMKQAIK